MTVRALAGHLVKLGAVAGLPLLIARTADVGLAGMAFFPLHHDLVAEQAAQTCEQVRFRQGRIAFQYSAGVDA